MKLLLYCTKAKPYLRSHSEYEYNEKGAIPETRKRVFTLSKHKCDYYNGKIVAECDFEVEEILHTNNCISYYCRKTTLLQEKSCLTDGQIYSYLKDNKGYAIHIKNLHIFDEPKELSDYESFAGYRKYYQINDFVKLEKVPQNMCKVLKPYIRFNSDFKAYEDFDILISIRPEWLVKILNGEQTIIVKKKVLKEMLKDE